MKRITISFIVFVSQLTFTSCSQTSNADLENQGEVSVLSFKDHGCVDLSKKVDGTVKSGDALNSWDYKNGVLYLDFQFNAICGCLFEEEINVSGSIIEIILTDTSGSHARCFCDYKEDFSFSVAQTNQVQIIFVVKVYPNFEKTVLVDRVLIW